MTSEMKGTTIVFSKNCFDIIRYFAAFSVMFLHYTGYALTLSKDGFSFMGILRQIVSFFPGVVVLFSISGFLITASFEKSKSSKEFFIKRIIRLYPELWVCTLVNLFVVCFLGKNLLDKSILKWLATQIIGIANTPSCLKSFATGSINGALWTVFTEVQLYAVLGITYRILQKLSVKNWLFLLGFFAVTNVVCDFVTNLNNSFVDKIIERTFIPYAIWFFIGTFCYIYREKVIPILKKSLLPVLVLYTITKFCPIKIPGYYANIAVGVLCPMIVIGAGYALPSVRLKCDITYGIFLYHWIVLNVIVYFDFMNKSWWLSLVLYIALTLLLSFSSWKLIGLNSKNMLNRLLKTK